MQKVPKDPANSANAADGVFVFVPCAALSGPTSGLSTLASAVVP